MRDPYGARRGCNPGFSASRYSDNAGPDEDDLSAVVMMRLDCAAEKQPHMNAVDRRGTDFAFPTSYYFRGESMELHLATPSL